LNILQKHIIAPKIIIKKISFLIIFTNHVCGGNEKKRTDQKSSIDAGRFSSH